MYLFICGIFIKTLNSVLSGGHPKVEHNRIDVIYITYVLYDFIS